MAYSKQYLIEKLEWLLDKYGTIQTKLIDKEPEFPNRKAYVRVFGTIEAACEAIGYYEYKKHKFNIRDAQKVLDIRNGQFELLDFNGMGEKNLTRCKKCGNQWNVITDSLLRNDTPSNGCPQCARQIFLNKLADNNLQEIEYLGNSEYRVRCTQCSTIFEGLSSSLSNPKFLCPYCPTNNKYIKIGQNKNLYCESTVRFSEFVLHLENIVNEESLMWYYCLGLLFADGHFDNATNRITLSLHINDKETVNSIAKFLNCKSSQEKNRMKISFCGGYVVQNLITKYNISNTKTYNPCNIDSITSDKMVAFIIGFIDGDGCIRKRTDSDLYNITIKLHKSWKENLELMSMRLYNFFNIEKYPHTTTIKAKDKEYVQITFGNSTVLNGLVDFIRDNKLVAMKRKWDKIQFSRKYQENIELRGV